MSRNPDFQFLDTNAEQLIADLSAAYVSLSGLSLHPASPEKLILQWLSNALLHERQLTNYAANQNIPSRAEGQNLDALAELFFQQKRSPAQPASCTVRFHISQARASAILIPAGTRVTDTARSLYWQTLKDGFIPAGQTSTDLPVQCQTTGAVGNGWDTGSIRAAVDVYDYYSGCENITVSDGGADEMTDNELYEAMRLSMDAFSTAGSIGSYTYHAKAVSAEIADVAVTSPSPGEVRIFALMSDGSPAGQEIKNQIAAACSADDVRPLTDHVQVSDPKTVPYDIDLTYWTESAAPSATEISAAVQSAKQNFIKWQSAKMGRDINPSKLHAMLMAAGVRRVEIRQPTYQTLSGGESDTPQVAALRSVTIINGGAEND